MIGAYEVVPMRMVIAWEVFDSDAIKPPSARKSMWIHDSSSTLIRRFMPHKRDYTAIGYILSSYERSLRA